MRSSLHLLATFIAAGASTFAQTDWAGFASDLRAKYGPPLARATFTAKPGIQMVVDYAANGNVCRIQLPPIAPTAPGVEGPQGIDNFLAELLPASIRGTEHGRFAMMFGVPGASVVEYENVSITEMLQGRTRTGVTVTFTKERCQDQPAR